MAEQMSPWEYLKPKDGPVVDGLEQHEIVFAKDQPEYIPLRTLRSNYPTGKVLSRWTLTPHQRQMIAAGADIFLELLTFHQPLQPIVMGISDRPNADFFADGYGLKRSGAARTFSQVDSGSESIPDATGHSA